MNDTITNAYRQVCDEILKLQAVKAAMEKAAPGITAGSAEFGSVRVVASGRAPRGSLEGAIREALKAKPGMVNGEIRLALKRSGYAHNLEPRQVGKTLSRMVGAKQLTAKRVGSRTEYTNR